MIEYPPDYGGHIFMVFQEAEASFIGHLECCSLPNSGNSLCCTSELSPEGDGICQCVH